MWDPAVYRRFGAERSRPFFDLTARIGAERPRAVVDLGCGPGELTLTLAERWPDARVAGVDSSPEMIEKAVAHGGPAWFQVGDVREWKPGPDVDVLVTNATLQWVEGHRDLLARWVVELPPGAWLAMQVPGNFDAPSHRLLRAVAGRFGVGHVTREAPVDDPEGYAELLLAAGAVPSPVPGPSDGAVPSPMPGPSDGAVPSPMPGPSDGAVPSPVPGPSDGAANPGPSGMMVDAWETTYLHLLPAGGDEHPVLRWMEGTALRPVKAALDENAWQSFRAELGRELAAAYPAAHGHVAFPFRRVFVVARTAA